MKKNSFEKNGLLIFSLSILGSALNYLFQILSGRILTTSEYGELNSLFSIINIVTVLGTAMGLSIAKYVAENDKEIGGSVIKIFKQSLLFALCLFLLLSLILYFIFHFSIMSSALVSLSISSFSVSYIFYGTMQGKKDFIGVSIFNLIQPVAKITVGMILMFILAKYSKISEPYNIVFLVIIGASLFGMYYGFKRSVKSVIFSVNSQNKIIINIYKFFLFSLMSSVCLVIFNNIDILIIRQFFDETSVGYYSSAALFGKIILYVPTAFTIMMVPIVAEDPQKGKTALKKTLLYAGFLSVFSAIMLFILRKFIIMLLMGEKYIPSMEYILPVCIMIIPLVFVTVLVNYLLASGYEKFATVSCAVAVITMIVSVMFIHQYIQTVLNIFTIVYVFLLIVLSVKCLLINSEQKTKLDRRENK